MGKDKYRLKREARLPADLLESKAFCEIKGAKAIRILIRFYQKRRWIVMKKRNEYIDEPQAFTYAEAEVLGIGPSRFHEVIRELYRLGFIDVSHQGGGLARDYSRYALSERWRKYGTPEFEHREKPRSVRPGRDIATLKMKKAQAGGEAKQVTGKRDYQLRSSVTVGA